MAFRQLAERHDGRIAVTADSARAVVEEAERALIREARLLAQDPAVVEGAVRRDWATLARGASPRMITLTVERLADILFILDATGGTLAQVPAVPHHAVPELGQPSVPSAGVRVIGGRPYLLGVAPIRSDDAPVGLVVVGRRLEYLETVLKRVPERSAVVAVAGDHLIGATRADVQATGWTSVTREGTVTLGAERWSVRPLDAGAGLWTLVLVGEPRAERRQLLVWLVGSFVLAASLAVVTPWVTGRRRMARELATRNRELEALLDVTRTMAGGGDVKATAEELLAIVCGVARMDAGAVYRLEGEALRLVAQRDVAPAELARFHVRPTESSHLGEAIRSGRIVVTDLARSRLLDPEVQEFARILGRRTQLALPISVDDRPWGVMALLSGEPRQFAPEEARLLEAVAHQIGLAVTRASLVADASHKGRRLETLARLGQTLTATLSLEIVLQRVVDAAVEIFAAGEARLWLVDPGGGTVSLRAGSGAGALPVGRDRFAVGEGLVGAVVATRAPLIVADVAAADRTGDVGPSGGEASRAFAGVPLTLGDRVLGALTIEADQRRDYSEEIGLLQSLAGHAAVAIDSAQRFGEATSRRAELVALLEINKKIAAAESPKALLGAIAEEAARLLDVDNAGFRLVEGDELVLGGLAGTAAEVMLRPRIKIGESFAGRVVSEGRTIVADIADVPELIPEHRAGDERLGYTTLLGVPMRAGDRIIGVLAFRARRPFTTRDRELAEAFAGQAAIALEHARLYHEASRQVERLAALAEVERLIAETLDLDVVAQRVADNVCMLLGAQASGVYRVEPGSGHLIGLAWSSRDHISRPWNPSLPRGTGIVGLAVHERRPIVSENILTDPRITLTPDARARVESAPFRAALGMPLVAREEVIGGLSVGDVEGRVFTEQDIRLAQAFADQATVALENARLYHEANQQAERMAALAEVERLIAETLDPDIVAQRIAESVCRLFDVKAAAVYRMAPESGTLVVIGFSGLEGSEDGWVMALPRGMGLVGLAVRERSPVASQNIATDPRVEFTPAHRAQIERALYRAVLAVPLMVKSNVIGALSMRDREGRAFSEDDTRLAQAFANQAALALENARLHEDAGRRRREAEILADLGRTITASLDLGTVLQRIAEGARELCGSDVARIALREAGTDRLRFRYWVGERNQAYDRLPIEPGAGVSGRVLTTGRPARSDHSPEAPSGSPEPASALEGEEIVTELSVPIRIGDAIEGVLNVDNRSARPFTDRHEAILLRLADHAAIAIQNARLYENVEIRAARLRTLANVNRVVSASLDTDEVLRAIARAASELMDQAIVAFWVADERTRTLRFSTFSDDRIGEDFPLSSLAFGEGVVGWVADHRCSLYVPDVFADERYFPREWARAQGITSLYATPIVLQGSLLGVLTLTSRAPLNLQPDDQSLLESFVAQAAVALDHARLYAATTRRLEQTRALLEVAEILNSTLDPQQLLKRVTIRIAQVCRVDRCSLELWDGDRVIPLMSQFADGHHDHAMWEAFTRMASYSPRAVPALARALETRRAVILEDATQTDQIPREWVAVFQHKSYMVVPLLRQDQVIGILTLDYLQRVTPFQQWQVDLATAIAGQLALSLENTRLYTEAQERLQETTTLLAVGRVLSERASIDEMLRRVAREAARAVGADTAIAYRLDPAHEGLVPLAGYHVPKQLLAEAFSGRRLVAAEHPTLVEIVQAGHAVYSSDLLNDPRFSQPALEGLPPTSVIFAPTVARGEVTGGLALYWWRTGREFAAAEVRLIEGLASQVGLAIENAELDRQRESRLRETETLLAVSRTLSSTLDFNTLLRHFLRQIARATGADTVGICMLDDASGDWLAPVTGYRVPTAWLSILPSMRVSVRDHAFYAEAARTKRAVFAADITTDPRLPDFVRERTPHRSQLFVPILAKERLIGGFVAAWLERTRQFSPGELTLMEAIANQAGVALENVSLFEQNRRQVEELSVLYELSRAVTGQLDRQALLEALRLQVPRVLVAETLEVLLLDDAGAEVESVLRVEDGIVDAEPPRRRPRTTGLMADVLDSGRPLRTDDYAAESRRRGRPAGTRPERRCWLGAPLTAGDAMLGVLALGRNTRPFTEAEERLATNITDLAALALRSARLFEDRTRAYGELAAAQDHLVRTEKLRALGEMASGVAHDFNNLLAAILGRSQLLVRQLDDPKLKQWAQIIERAATDGAQTIRRLQEFARVRRDQPRVAVDLNEVIHDALEITQSRWRDESLRQGITVDVQTRLTPVPQVAGDPAELREALTNLILNAVDAMPQGGTLTLSSAVVGGDVEIAIADTGVGMPESVREKIFDPFFTTKGPQGTGLGLAMTYGIVSRHGARITVESTEGRGSTFRLTFTPTTAAAVPPPAVPSKPEAGRVLRCLVVDDEEAVGTVIGDVLETIGHEAVVLTDGATAIDRFQREAFDVVFTDLAMPGVSGWQVARAVKAAAPDVTVFVVTGFGIELSPEEQRGHGVEAVFPKPLKIEDIAEAVSRVTQRAAKTDVREDR